MRANDERRLNGHGYWHGDVNIDEATTNGEQTDNQRIAATATALVARCRVNAHS
jgi:hypothetical protein